MSSTYLQLRVHGDQIYPNRILAESEFFQVAGFYHEGLIQAACLSPKIVSYPSSDINPVEESPTKGRAELGSCWSCQMVWEISGGSTTERDNERSV